MITSRDYCVRARQWNGEFFGNLRYMGICDPNDVPEPRFLEPGEHPQFFWQVLMTKDGAVVCGGGRANRGWSRWCLAYDETGKSLEVTLTEKIATNCYWKASEMNPEQFPIGHPKAFSITLQPMNGEVRDHFLMLSPDGMPTKGECPNHKTAWKLVLSKDNKHYLSFRQHD